MFSHFLMNCYLWKLMVNVPTESNTQKHYKKLIFSLDLESHWRKEQDPDPSQNVTDPEHWTWESLWRTGSYYRIVPSPGLILYYCRINCFTGFETAALPRKTKNVWFSPIFMILISTLIEKLKCPTFFFKNTYENTKFLKTLYNHKQISKLKNSNFFWSLPPNETRCEMLGTGSSDNETGNKRLLIEFFHL